MLGVNGFSAWHRRYYSIIIVRRVRNVERVCNANVANLAEAFVLCGAFGTQEMFMVCPLMGGQF